MKLYRLIARSSTGLASMHGLFSLSIESPPLTGIGMFALPSKPERPEPRKRFLKHLRAQLARRGWRLPA